MTTTTTTTIIILATIKTAVTFVIIGTVVLIIALIIRELATDYGNNKPTIKERLKALSKNAIVAIIPLATLFAMTVTLKVAECIKII